MKMTFKVAGDFVEERQKILKKLMSGSGDFFPVKLKKEMNNKFDPNAVAVLSIEGEKIGYVPRNIAADVGYALPILESSFIKIRTGGKNEDGAEKLHSELELFFKEEEM